MSPVKQRIAIAKAHGWTNIIIIPLAPKKKHSGEAGVSVCGARHPAWGFGSSSIPDYLGDLNACHEMEKVLDYEQCEAFSTTLADIVHAANREKEYAFPWAFARIHATAPQRCEAFLRTLGLWEEEQ